MSTGLGHPERQKVEMVLHAVGDPVEDKSTFHDAGAAPGVFRRVRGIKSRLDVPGVRMSHFAENLAVHR